MFRLNDGKNSDNGHFSGSTPATAQEDGYWDALMSQGEVATLVEPPPWASNGHSSTPCQDGYAQDDDQIDWKRAGCLLEQKECCHLVVVGFNRGGLLVQFGGLTGFVPSSHLVDFPGVVDPIEREDALKRRLGEALKLQVIEIDRPQSRLILSERIAREAERGESLFARIKAGDILTGRVSNLRRFGAFVDLGGYEGLIHISELSWGRVNYPGDVVRPGDTVQVYVLDVDPTERKIQLSLKHLQSDPWRDVAQRFRAGETVRGEVTNVVSFGAFVRLDEGIEGLIHISELAEGTFLHPRNVLREGQHVDVKVLSVESDNRRIGLSLRQARKTRHAAWPEGAGIPVPAL
jgi:small subunit ribosomal protein S1